MTEISISNRKLVDFAIAGRFVITRFNCNKIDPVLKCILLQDCVVQVKALAGTIVLCGCAFGQETQLSQCLSPCRCFPVQMDTGKFNARVNSVMYLTPIQGVGRMEIEVSAGLTMVTRLEYVQTQFTIILLISLLLYYYLSGGKKVEGDLKIQLEEYGLKSEAQIKIVDRIQSKVCAIFL